MGGRAIRGRVVDESGRPIPGLVITAYDTSILALRRRLLERTVTDNKGEYSLPYSPNQFVKLFGRNQEIALKVLDRKEIRELAMIRKSFNMKDTVSDFPDIVVRWSGVEGWAATLGGYSPSRLTQGNDAEILIDGMAAFASMAAAVKRAKSTIHLLQLWFPPDFIATFKELPGSETRPGIVLAHALLEASRRGVKVRILLNVNAIARDSVHEMSDFFKKAGNNDVSVRSFPITRQTIHAKMLIIDSLDDSEATAFIIGSPFEQVYWDTPDHLIIEPRRGHGFPGIGVKPTHDISIRLRGPAVAHVEKSFIDLWNLRSREEFHGADIISPPVLLKPAGTQSVQIVRSVPSEILSGKPKGEAGILEAYLRAIENAQDYIYLENQYFTSQTICDALRKALNTNPQLQVILLVNENTDIPVYKVLQNNLLKQIGLPHPRVGAFSLWRTGFDIKKIKIKRCYIHSKVAIVDDKWSTVGTANLDGVSLEAFADVIRRKKPSRNMEINAILLEGIDGQPSTGNIAEMRCTLWSEHIGLKKDALASSPAGGWLELWRGIARANIESLNYDQTMKGKILPYSHAASAKEQLKLLGVDTNKLHLLD